MAWRAIFGLVILGGIALSAGCEKRCGERRQCLSSERCIDEVCEDAGLGTACFDQEFDACASDQVCVYADSPVLGECRALVDGACPSGTRQGSDNACLGPEVCPPGFVFDPDIGGDDGTGCVAAEGRPCRSSGDCGTLLCRVDRVGEDGSVLESACIGDTSCPEGSTLRSLDGGTVCLQRRDDGLAACLPGEHLGKDVRNLPDGEQPADVDCVDAGICASGYEIGGNGACIDRNECAGVSCGAGLFCDDQPGRQAPPDPDELCQELPPSCGFDGFEPDKEEECDDGNQRSGDGCNAGCRIESNHVCVGAEGTDSVCTECEANEIPNADRTVCEPLCGNGIVEDAVGEACDDGTRADGAGCSATCLVEPGYVCSGSPSLCVESWPRSSAPELRVARNQTEILEGPGPHEFSTCVIDGTLELTPGSDWTILGCRRLTLNGTILGRRGDDTGFDADGTLRVVATLPAGEDGSQSGPSVAADLRIGNAGNGGNVIADLVEGVGCAVRSGLPCGLNPRIGSGRGGNGVLGNGGGGGSGGVINSNSAVKCECGTRGGDATPLLGGVSLSDYCRGSTQQVAPAVLHGNDGPLPDQSIPSVPGGCACVPRSGGSGGTRGLPGQLLAIVTPFSPTGSGTIDVRGNGGGNGSNGAPGYVDNSVSVNVECSGGGGGGGGAGGHGGSVALAAPGRGLLEILVTGGSGGTGGTSGGLFRGEDGLDGEDGSSGAVVTIP